MALRDPAATRYARAAFELAQERNELPAWERDLQAFGAALASPDAQEFVASHKVPATAKEELLGRLVDAPAPLVWNMVRLLASKGRLALLPQIAEDFQRLYDDERGVATAQVLTAVAISDDERRALERRLSELSGKQVTAQTFEAPEIIGGVVARIGDTLIDGSTRSKLIALKRRLSANGGAAKG